MQQPATSNHHVASPTMGTTIPSQRANRLLYRRGLPDLPELIELEEEESGITVTDDSSTNTFSTRHSASTSTSSREFPSSATFTAVGLPLSPKQGTLSQPRTPLQPPPSLEILTQTPPSSVPQLQTPFEYNPSNSFRIHSRARDEASPPPSPSPRDEALLHAGIGYGLGVSLTSSGNFGIVHESGMSQQDEQAHVSKSSGVYGDGDCLMEGCLECAGVQAPLRHPLGPYTTTSGDVDVDDLREYMSPPSSPGSECIAIISLYEAD